jgi:hypothetical protein
MDVVKQAAKADLVEGASYRSITIVYKDGSIKTIQIDANRVGEPVFQADINHMILIDPTDPANLIAINLGETTVVAVGYTLS